MIIIFYLENSLQIFLSIPGYRLYSPAREKNHGTVSYALLVIFRWLHSSPPIRETIIEKRPSSLVHLPTPIFSSTYGVFSSDFFPDTRRDYCLIVMYHRCSTLFIPPSLTWFFHLLPYLSNPTSSWLIATYIFFTDSHSYRHADSLRYVQWRATLFDPN